jgi:vacuolar-type H+-ATPase subunit E/Vma4
MPLQDMDKKLEAFTGTIITEAIEEADKLALELREKQDQIIRAAEGQIAGEADKYRKAELSSIKAAQERRISAKRNADKHALLQYRERCANETHRLVREKIAGFTASDAYLPHLKKQLKKAVDTLGYGFSVEVFLRPEDMKFADELLASATGVSLAFCEGDFSLGGLRVVCPSKGQRIDLSFDTALNDMVGHVSELGGLKMGD